MRTSPFNAPNRGWRSPFLAGRTVDVSAGFSSTRRNTIFRDFTSTCSVRNPASSQILVMTLFDGLLLHQAGYCGELGGSLLPITRSISVNVIGTSLLR